MNGIDETCDNRHNMLLIGDNIFIAFSIKDPSLIMILNSLKDLIVVWTIYQYREHQNSQNDITASEKGL